MPKKQPKPDAISTVVAHVLAATDSEPIHGEDLIADPETRRKFLEAKRQTAQKPKSKRAVVRR